MHGLDDNIKDHYEWVSHIRATLDSAIKNKIDFVHLIPKDRPLLRPLVLLITKMRGFNCYYNGFNKCLIIVDIKDNHDLTQYHFDLLYKPTPHEKSLIRLFDVNPIIFENIDINDFDPNTLNPNKNNISMKRKSTYLKLRRSFST